jgi:hypothetical protein
MISMGYEPATIIPAFNIRTVSAYQERNMPRRRPEPPRDWADLKSDDGAVIGSYSVRDGVITVRYPGGAEKATHARAGGSNEWLARLMLSESPTG